MEIEHEDRKRRLERLSEGRGLSAPEFYDYSIDPAQHHLANYPVKIPVLRVVFRDSTFFDFGQDQVKPEAGGILETIAASLRLEPPDVTVFIAGHTDAIGSENYNMGLGLRRSQAVASKLARMGIARSQLYVVSFGKAVPIADNDTEEGRAKNRRVEFLFAAQPAPIAAWLVGQKTCQEDRATKRDDCPVDLNFIARSVVVKQTPDTKNLDTSQPNTTIAFSNDVVTLDLRQKVFSFPPPQ